MNDSETRHEEPKRTRRTSAQVDLSTTYLGLKLPNPLVAASSPLTGDIEQLIHLEEAGCAAVVMPSLFEETISHEEAEVARLYDFRTQACPESLTYFPEMPRYNLGPDRYLLTLREAKKGVKMPVIASLNGSTMGGWTRYAKQLEQAGADAIELNIYFVPTDAQQAPELVEGRYLELIAAVRNATRVPLAVKIGPYFSNLAYTARRMVEAGADGLVLFNRYLEPDIRLDPLAVAPKLVLSTSNELRLPLRWLAILSSQLEVSLAATSGVHTAGDILKTMFAGAHVAMMASALLEHGPGHIAQLKDDLRSWLAEHDYASIHQLRGSMNRGNCPNASEFERANYTRALVFFADRTSPHG